MTRENKTHLRMALDENVQEGYEEMDDNIGEMVEWLFDDGLEKEEIMDIATKVRQSYIKQIIQLYSN